MGRLVQAQSNFKRFKVLDTPELGKEKCGGTCGRKLSSFYWVWVSSKDGQKVCMFCYANKYDKTVGSGRARLKKKDKKYNDAMLKIFLPWSPSDDVVFDVKARLEYAGPMWQCSICPKDCKVPFSTNVTKFVCMEYNIEEAKRRIK